MSTNSTNSSKNNIECKYTEHHPRSYTFKPLLQDNENLLDGAERLIQANGENKKHTINLLIIQSAVSDIVNKTSLGLEEIETFFIDIEEREEAILLYKKFQDLCKNYLTMKQLDVIFKYVVERKRLKDIAQEMDPVVTPAAILKSIRFIAKKVKKLNLQSSLLYNEKEIN